MAKIVPIWYKRRVVNYAIVDDADYPSVSAKKWHARYDRLAFRAYTFLSNTNPPAKAALHAFLIPGVKWPMSVDHINGNTLDNRRENLRVCHINDNNLNRPAQRNSASGIKGVWIERKTGKWLAQLRYKGVTHRRRGFTTSAEAHAAYCAMCVAIHGEFGRVG